MLRSRFERLFSTALPPGYDAQKCGGGGGTGGDAPYDPNISGGGYTGAVDCRGANPDDMYDYDCYGVDCSAPVGSLDYDAQKCGGSGRVPGLAYPKPKP
jgi:hypothetical protein